MTPDHSPWYPRIRLVVSLLILVGLTTSVGIAYVALATHPDATLPLLSTVLSGVTVVAAGFTGLYTFTTYPRFPRRVQTVYAGFVTIAILAISWNVYIILAIT
ncbi:hypothetical protein [Haladaptatus sp. NG-SE-30]